MSRNTNWYQVKEPISEYQMLETIGKAALLDYYIVPKTSYDDICCEDPEIVEIQDQIYEFLMKKEYLSFVGYVIAKDIQVIDVKISPSTLDKSIHIYENAIYHAGEYQELKEILWNLGIKYVKKLAKDDL